MLREYSCKQSESLAQICTTTAEIQKFFYSELFFIGAPYIYRRCVQPLAVYRPLIDGTDLLHVSGTKTNERMQRRRKATTGKTERGTSRLLKPKFHGRSFLAASSQNPRDILAKMSLTYHEEIGRVGRVGRGCYEETAPVEFKLYATILLDARERRDVYTKNNSFSCLSQKKTKPQAELPEVKSIDR